MRRTIDVNAYQGSISDLSEPIKNVRFLQQCV
uniref:Uncharacterized protein n=1 Tax=Anguilla anguilla TaxID=7936 RepID=A0A0E9QN03_ANGAN